MQGLSVHALWRKQGFAYKRLGGPRRRGYLFPEEIKLKAYDIEVEFAYKGAIGTANSKIESFLDYLTGKGDTGTNLKVYDTYTKIGRQGVYYKSIDQDLFVRKSDEGDVVTFKITFRVTDPRTPITLSV